ncbi:MAG: nucleotidyltransferase family protein [Terriglobales bacterium]
MSALATHPALHGPRPTRIAELHNSPELELLLTCARREVSADHIRHALELLDHSLNWSVLLEQARAHRLLPLLYWHWKRTLRLDFPAEIAHQLDGRFRANVARSLLLVQDLADIVDLLGRHGIPVVPFKGPALAEGLYGNAALRECVDLDILIRRGDVPEAIRTLVSAGYVDEKQLTPAQQNAFLATQYEYPLLSPSGILVELQWRIVPRCFSLALSEEQYWSRIRPSALCGRKMNSLSCEDLLLLLCFHGGKHGWEKLIWLADVGELLVSNPHLDWKYVRDQARQAGGLRMLLLGVVLANKLLGTTIPRGLEPPLARDRMVERIADGMGRDLVRGELPSYVKSQLYLLRVRERWQDRLRYALRFTCTATPMEWEMVDLPPSLSVLYRFLRLLRGLGKAMSLAGNTASRLIKGKVPFVPGPSPPWR